MSQYSSRASLYAAGQIRVKAHHICFGIDRAWQQHLWGGRKGAGGSGGKWYSSLFFFLLFFFDSPAWQCRGRG